MVLEILGMLSDLQEDDCTPKNIKNRICCAMDALKCKDRSISMKIDASLQELEEVSEDSNIPAFTKTQIYSIVSKLECIK